MSPSEPLTGAQLPAGIDHLVLLVRDLDDSHQFRHYLIGFEPVGEMPPTPDRPTRIRFYAGGIRGALHHHHLGLRENPELPHRHAADNDQGMSHVAVRYPDRDTWLAQLRFLASEGTDFRPVDHGMTHSAYLSDPDGHRVELLYELPREIWAGNVADALNDYQVRPADELVDRTDYLAIHHASQVRQSSPKVAIVTQLNSDELG